MTGVRRGVTRAYVWTLNFACVILSLAFLSVAWGVITLSTDSLPIRAKVPVFVGPLLAAAGLGMQAWLLGHMAIHLLKGARGVPLHYVSLPGLCAYLIWCFGGMILGLNLGDTWTSPYALSVIPVMFVTSFFCWAALWRRVYTDKETPMWPWDRREDELQEIYDYEMMYRSTPEQWREILDRD